MKKNSKFIYKLVFTVGGITLIIYILRDKIDEVIDIIQSCNVLIFLSALIIFISINILSALRLQTVLRMQQIKIPLLKVWKIYYLGYFFNLFLPSSVGGDIAKGYYLYKHSARKAKSFLSVLIDRMIGLFSLVFLCAFSVLILQKRITNPNILIVVMIAVAVSIFACIFFTNKRLASLSKFLKPSFISDKFANRIKQWYLIIYECRRHKKYAGIAFIYSLVFQLITISTNYIVAKSLHIPLSLGLFFLLIPLVYVFALLPSINGLGVREGAYIYFFSFFTSTENAFALSIMSDVLLYSCSLVGMVCYLFHKEISYKEIKTSHIDLDEISIENTEDIMNGTRNQ